MIRSILLSLLFLSLVIALAAFALLYGPGGALGGLQ